MSDPSELAGLRDKYAHMKRLRDEGPTPAHRDALRALAASWPGSLAEIDRIPPAVLAHRLDTLERILDGRERELPTWARGWILAHRGLRGALAVKAWLRGRRVVDDHVSSAFAHALDALPVEAAAFRDRLQEIASPPNGRLVDVVFEDVARELGIDPRAVRTLLMPRA